MHCALCTRGVGSCGYWGSSKVSLGLAIPYHSMPSEWLTEILNFPCGQPAPDQRVGGCQTTGYRVGAKGCLEIPYIGGSINPSDPPVLCTVTRGVMILRQNSVDDFEDFSLRSKAYGVRCPIGYKTAAGRRRVEHGGPG
jgi:hypothetical protein